MSSIPRLKSPTASPADSPNVGSRRASAGSRLPQPSSPGTAFTSDSPKLGSIKRNAPVSVNPAGGYNRPSSVTSASNVKPSADSTPTRSGSANRFGFFSTSPKETNSKPTSPVVPAPAPAAGSVEPKSLAPPANGRRVSADSSTHSSASEALADLQRQPRLSPERRVELVDLLAELVGGQSVLSEWVDVESLKTDEDPASSSKVGTTGPRRESGQWLRGDVPSSERPASPTTTATTVDSGRKINRSVSSKSSKRGDILGKFGWRSSHPPAERTSPRGGKLQKSPARTPPRGSSDLGHKKSSSGSGDRTLRVFGTPLKDVNRYASCVTIIGGQRHVLPIVAFAAVEDIYKRGMNIPGLLRIAGDLDRVDRLVTLFDSPPSYGDGYAVASEDVHTLCGLLKRYLRALPEPLLDPRLGTVFWHACVEPAIQVSDGPAALGMPLSTGPDDRSGSHSDKRRVATAQCILRLLPTKCFSLLVYVTAFLSQAPLFPDNKLTLESVASLLGPALLGARPVGGDDEKAGQGLLWLLRNWNEVTDGLLDERFDVDVAKLRSPTPMPPIAMPGRFPSTDTVGQMLQKGEAPRSYPVVVSESQQAEVVDDDQVVNDIEPPMATAPEEQPLDRSQRDSSLSPTSKTELPPDAQDAFAALSGLISSRDEIIRGQADRLTAASDEHATLSRQLSDCESRLRQNETEHGTQSESLRQEISTLMARLSTNEEQTGQLRQEMEAEQARAKEEREGERAKAREEAEEMQRQLEEVRRQKADLQKELDDARRQRDEHFKQVSAVKKVLGFVPEE